ncbi:zinc finger protein 271 isoform X2 [Rhipicephalus sanguineus]|uniref:zinc finger protein 271 isoform X2 n=1 Tax=Rhipicephalus sanguineus TaxID=34632 RepID=UPI001895431E|nr:zinc finger protein 271 isoform X2 [Rhipicephalus sanguineus]
MPYPCELCSSKFHKQESLNRHKQLHASGAGLYHCHECNKVFVSRQVFKAHQWRHKGEKPYPCRLCPATFVYRRGLDRHSLVHMSEKSYICSVCQKNFVWKKSLKVHMKRRHSGPTESAASVIGAADLTVPCSLPSRLRPILPHVDKEFSCHLCPAIFDCSSDMDKHVVVHIGERPHICPVCRRSFAWENNLVLHMSRRHGGANTIMATADHQVETTLPNDLPFTLVPVACADVKVEPCIPTTTLPPISASVDIKAEPSSPTTTPSPVITSTDIKAEPSSPTTTLPFTLTLVDIKTEPDLTP